MVAKGTGWVVLLRGINVGRAKRVAMADLRALLESLGFDDVTTVLQSGNATFVARERGPAKIEDTVAAAIQRDLQLDVKVLARTAAEFAAVADANPFVTRAVDPKQLHVAFLSAAPSPKKVAALDPADYLPDEFELGDRVIYLRLPGGVMGSRFPDWERVLGVTVTVRNWNTVNRLRART